MILGDVLTPVVASVVTLAAGVVLGWFGKRFIVKARVDHDVENIQSLCEDRGKEIADIKVILSRLIENDEKQIRAQRRTMRRGLVIDYNHYKEKGKLPIYALESMKERHESYRELGGNGALDQLMSDLMDLPRE